jgi:hypothetical protein
MFAISTALLPSPLFERVRVRAEASMMFGMVAVVVSLALAPWGTLALAPSGTTEQRVTYELAAAQEPAELAAVREPAELLKPPTIGIGSSSQAAFAATRRVHHTPNRRHAHLWRTLERARVL